MRSTASRTSARIVRPSRPGHVASRLWPLATAASVASTVAMNSLATTRDRYNNGLVCQPRRGVWHGYTAPLAMPKMKSHSGAKKRFKRTAGGKLRARHANSSHILEKKSPKRKRAFGKDRVISKADRKTVNQLLGGKHS